MGVDFRSNTLVIKICGLFCAVVSAVRGTFQLSSFLYIWGLHSAGEDGQYTNKSHTLCQVITNATGKMKQGEGVKEKWEVGALSSVGGGSGKVL